MKPPFAATESCTSSVFEIYRQGQPTNTDAVLTVSIWSHDETTWAFSASYVDPPSSPNDRAGSGFDDVNYYCGFIDGRLARSTTGWRAWIAPSVSGVDASAP